MANDNIKLFNFYRRYRWTETDFTNWQQGMVDHSRGMFDGLFGGGVLKGFQIAATGGNMTINVGTGIASGPSGFLNVVNQVNNVTVIAPTGTNRKDLIVVRPNLVNGDNITSPTNPFVTVPLTTAQQSSIVVLQGIEANSPDYPTKEENDVVLAGVRLSVGQTSVVESDVDFEVRDLLGKNSNFQQDQGKYDDRMRPYKSTNKIMGIKPSQLEAPFARVFSYVNKSTPSIFPKDGSGNYNAADTFLNMETGTISGGDAASSDFTPQIPTSGNAIVACISIKSDDTLAVAYGTIGTRQQCYDGIKNQKSVGAGSVSITASTKPIAFVIVYSKDGLSVTEIDFFDCRGLFGVGESSSGLGGGGVTTPGVFPYALSAADDGKVLLIDTTTARTLNLFAANAGFKVTIKDKSGLANNNAITVIPNGIQKIEGLASNYLMEANWGMWTLNFDGTDWFIIA